MAQVIPHELIMLEGEWHISGDLCWCGSHYDIGLNIFIHRTEADAIKTHPNTAEYLQ